MNLEKRKTLPLKVKLPKLESLKALSNSLTRLARLSFIHKYGNILDLLYVDVQADAILTLAQFYDPPTRSFLFKDFQLAPTLEEFGSILKIPSKGKGPYTEIGAIPENEDLARALDIDALNLEENIRERRKNVKGYPYAYLEEKAYERATYEDKEPFINILALLVYGLVLFPSFEDFIDFTAVSVFWAVCKKDKDPVPTLLADTYYELHERHLREKGSISLCLPLLYRWFTSFLPKDQPPLEQMEKGGWPRLLVSLTENTVCWHPLKRAEQIIIRCGRYPNVPLIGSKGCINYNPILALKQLGRPLWDQPEEWALKGLIINDKGIHDTDEVSKIIRAWEDVHRIKGGLKRKSEKETYSQWVKERVRKVKIPFLGQAPNLPIPPAPLLISMEEANALRAKVTQLEKDKELLEAETLKIAQEGCGLKRDIDDKDEIIKRLQQELELEKKGRVRMSDALKGANAELTNRKKDINELIRRIGELRKCWKASYTEEIRLREQLEIERQEFQEGLEAERQGFQEELETERQKYQDDYEDLLHQEKEAWEKDLETALANSNHFEEVAHYYRTRSEKFQQKSNLWVNNYNDLVKQIENGEVYQAFREEKDFWMDRSNKLTALANGVLEEVFVKLKAANGAVLPWEIPDDVQRFLECCNNLVEELKRRIRDQ